MAKIINLTGLRFSKLIVLNFSRFDKRGGAFWCCQCDCGNIKDVRSDSLRNKSTTSCGCWKKEKISEALKKLEKGLSAKRSLYSRYKASAFRRNLEFNLTFEQFISITSEICYYCKSKPSQIYQTHRNNGDYIYNGIDRIDNTKGYTIENCVPCCKICNRAKDIMSLFDFKEWLNKVFNNMNSKE